MNTHINDENLTVQIKPDAVIIPDIQSDGYDNLFFVKYTKNGDFIWGTKISTYVDDVIRPNTVVDLNGNIYLSRLTCLIIYKADF